MENNAYFPYMLCTLFNVILLYIAYRLFKYLKRTRCVNNSCCKSLSNCLTLNIFKNTKKNVNIESDLTFDLDRNTEINSIDLNNSTTPLRRSSRIAQLKDNP